MDVQEKRERVVAILSDPEWTANVVKAAVVALGVLCGPPITADGDQAAMVARSTLDNATTDLRALQGLSAEIDPLNETDNGGAPLSPFDGNDAADDLHEGGD